MTGNVFDGWMCEVTVSIRVRALAPSSWARYLDHDVFGKVGGDVHKLQVFPSGRCPGLQALGRALLDDMLEPGALPFFPSAA